ncbi:TetR family transcriptional regulator [Hassallia byssoidea VB512170]|uniref:TetR family transcriptional regulator n=1 Tax=Hassallia byssoidea VB512170 TaxID=1304833 RepID=A0A846H8U3_9CYAN|nr:TetR family transcriptional regulator [Hassalia byssoidea]NEU73735.1 TetR family transcriptional regulator [Hassalia byssoidea VB512170]
MPATPSKIGRPSKSNRNPDEVKTEILAAAMKEFSQHGLRATSTEAIAHRAHVTKAMIHYYFKSKEGLYRAVLENQFSGLLTPERQEEFTHNSPEQALANFIQQVLRNASSQPDIHTLLALEAIQNQGLYYKELEVGQLVYGTLSCILERGVEAGVFRPLNPQHMAVNILGTILFYFISQGNLQHFFQEREISAQDMIEEHTTEAIAFIMAGVLRAY